MRSSRLAVAAATFSLLAACTDADVPAPVTIEPPFSDPSWFAREGCAPGSLAGLDVAGIWHHDNLFTGGEPFPSPTRYDVDAAGAISAKVFGLPAGDVRLTPDDLFVRTEWTTPDDKPRLFAFDACALEPDGALSGKFAFCDEVGCYLGTFKSVRVERIAGEVGAEGLDLVSEWAGDAAAPWGEGISVNVRVAGGIAYLARYEDGLRIVDVADPASPRDLGGIAPVRVDDGEIYNDVKVVAAGERTYALMASNRRGVVVVDATDPGAPAEVATFPPIPEGKDRVNVHTLFTESDGERTLAYLAVTSIQGIRVYDVTDPVAPVGLGAYVHPQTAKNDSAFVHDLYVEDAHAYLCSWDLGLMIVDATDPSDVRLEGQFREYDRRTSHSVWVTEADGRRIAVHGDEDWDAHLRIVDVDPTSGAYMTEIGALALRPEVSVHNIMAFGDRAYVAWYQDGVRILDLSKPTEPRQIAYFNTWDGRRGDSFYEGAVGIDVDLDAGLVYVADSERGLLVLRVLATE